MVFSVTAAILYFDEDRERVALGRGMQHRPHQAPGLLLRVLLRLVNLVGGEHPLETLRGQLLDEDLHVLLHDRRLHHADRLHGAARPVQLDDLILELPHTGLDSLDLLLPAAHDQRHVLLLQLALHALELPDGQVGLREHHVQLALPLLAIIQLFSKLFSSPRWGGACTGW